MATTCSDGFAWHQVLAVGIRTTADGPFAEDLYWQLLVGERVIEVPGALIDDTWFEVVRDRLPGLDWVKVAMACGSVEERVFSVWDRAAAERPGDRALGPRLAALVGRLGGDPTRSGEVFDRLHAAWTAKDRRYHDLRHLTACLHELDAARAEAPTADLVELALWYHDAVYQPGARDCEQRSADLLTRDAAVLALPADTVRRAADLVRATAHAHGAAEEGDPAVDLIVDIDLSILGRDIFAFMDFEYGVEEEFAATPTMVFRIARGRFLASLLAAPRIFRSAGFRARYERRAREQIGALLSSPRYRAYRWGGWLPIAHH